MTVLRIDHSSGGWTAMRNATADDKSLDADTLGVLYWLLSKSHDWEVYPEVVRKRFGLGRKVWSRITKQLIKAGFYHRHVIRLKEPRGKLLPGQLITMIVVSSVPFGYASNGGGTDDRSPGASLGAPGSPSALLGAPGEPGAPKGAVARPTSRQGYSVTNTNKTKTKKPPTGEASAANDGGGRSELVELAMSHGLDIAEAHRFAKAGAGASPEQLEILRSELPIRLPGARRGRTNLAIGLAQAATEGRLQDSTRGEREAIEAAARRREEEERQLVEQRKADELALAMRRTNGPSAAEKQGRAALAQLKREFGSAPSLPVQRQQVRP